MQAERFYATANFLPLDTGTVRANSSLFTCVCDLSSFAILMAVSMSSKKNISTPQLALGDDVAITMKGDIIRMVEAR